MTALTPRQQEAMTLIVTARATTNHAIADEMGITYESARRHVGEVFRKLDVHSKVELVLWARRKEARDAAVAARFGPPPEQSRRGHRIGCICSVCYLIEQEVREEIMKRRGIA